MRPAVIWAVDPFETKTRPHPEVLKDFFAWMTLAGFDVQPVHVLGYSTARESVGRSLDVADHLIPEAEDAVSAFLEGLGVSDFKNLLPSKVISAPAKSKKKEIQKILFLSEAANSPMIAVTSYGSFAETLLLDSPHPVFCLAPSHPSPSEAPVRVLFPTDFSKQSHQSFREFLSQVQPLKAEVILFHAITVSSLALAPGGLYGTGDIGIPSDYFADMATWSKDEGKRWISEATQHGVPARLYLVDEGIAGNVAQAILRAAHEIQARMIAMAGGAVAREVFRSHEYPVWVWGPKASATGSLSLSEAS